MSATAAGYGPRIGDLIDPQLWDGRRDVGEVFACLRRDAPVSWQRDPSAEGFTAGPGYWAVVRHPDVVEVGTDPRRFSSEPTTSIRDLPPDLAEFFGFMLNMDDPRHGAFRRVVSHAFTPRRLGDTRQLATRIAEETVATACATGRCDAVDAVAAPVPLRVICELMGIPQSDWKVISQQGEVVTLARDAKAMLSAAQLLHGLAKGLAEARRHDPTDDLTSALVHADVDGARLTPAEIGSFFMLLVVAGVQTTRHAISDGLVTLATHPDERERWIRNTEAVTPTAVEEIIRWATPVRHFRRTATQDCTIGDTKVSAGDKVVLWYTSANRDGTVFDDPDTFDVTRHPNPHVSFGAGPHFCLGATLARHEIAAVFTALLRRAPHWIVEDAVPIASSFMYGYERVICRFA